MGGGRSSASRWRKPRSHLPRESLAVSHSRTLVTPAGRTVHRAVSWRPALGCTNSSLHLRSRLDRNFTHLGGSMPNIDNQLLSKQALLRQVLQQAAHSISASLKFYWPQTGNNDVPERVISLHLASALMRPGFLVYGEAHRNGTSDERYDLLALDPVAGTLLVSEHKRLYNAPQARSMANDVDRILKFSLQDWHDATVPFDHRFGVVAATTWREDYAAWFCTLEKDPKDPTEDGSLTSMWKAASARSERAQPWSDSLPVMDYVDSDGKRKTQWLVYMLFPF